MSEERPEALLKSALEKIVYFEARSEQLQNDLLGVRSESDRLKQELAAAAQREIELRRQVAELEVRAARAQQQNGELGRVNEALRAERTGLLEKIIDASRIDAAGREDAEMFDLAGFIAQLRSEVIQGAKNEPPPPPPVEEPAPSPEAAAVNAHAERFLAQGRLHTSDAQMMALSTRQGPVSRPDETLFGFSVRELSAPDAAARIRAAERLKSLKNKAAAPALATAIHVEHEAEVQVALLNAFIALAPVGGAAIVLPLLGSPMPDVRITALKALLTLEPSSAGPHLSAAMKDPDRVVRRRASLLALSLTGDAALKLGEEAIRDSDADVRGLAALVLGAGSGEGARALLMQALRDPELKVRQSAARSVSRLLGVDVTGLVRLDDAQRRREVRKLANLPLRPVLADLRGFTELVDESATLAERSSTLEAAAVERRQASARTPPARSVEPELVLARAPAARAAVNGAALHGAGRVAAPVLAGNGSSVESHARGAMHGPAAGYGSAGSGAAYGSGAALPAARAAGETYGSGAGMNAGESYGSGAGRVPVALNGSHGSDAAPAALNGSRGSVGASRESRSAKNGEGMNESGVHSSDPARALNGSERSAGSERAEMNGGGYGSVAGMNGSPEARRQGAGSAREGMNGSGDSHHAVQAGGSAQSAPEPLFPATRGAPRQPPRSAESQQRRQQLDQRLANVQAQSTRPSRPAAPASAPEGVRLQIGHPLGVARPAAVAALNVGTQVDEALCENLVNEVRCAIRGRTMPELCTLVSRPAQVVEEACELLIARGRVVRRGMKYFFA